MDAPARAHLLPVRPDASTLEIARTKEKNAIRAAELGLPAPGSKLINAHGIEWVIDGYTTARSLVSYAHPNEQFDLYPAIIPQNFSERLTKFAAEINRCTPKALVPLDTLPLRFPKRAHPGGHSVDHTSDPGRILLYTDAASVSETIFAHELAHVWIDLVQGIEDYRVLKDTTDAARYAQVQFVQSFVLDIAVNQVLREKGFGTSAIEEDSRAALANLARLAERGFEPATKREALFMAQAVAAELLERKGGTGILRADDPFLPISSGLSDIFKLGEHIAESVQNSPPTCGPSARTAIDDLLRLSFDFTDDPLDFETELIEVQPNIDWKQDKDPQWLPFQTVVGKCEVGVAMARTGASAGSSYGFSYDPSGLVSVSFTRDDGSRTDPVRLTHVRQLGPGQPDLADRIMAMNKKARRHVDEEFERAMKGIQAQPTNRPPGLPPIPGQRSYSSGLARWLTQVRLEEYLGGEHPYAYAYNNPTTYVDPTGDSPEEPKWPEWTPPFLRDPETMKTVKDCIAEAIAANPNCAKTGLDAAYLAAVMRCIIGCENRDVTSPTIAGTYVPDPGYTKETGGIGPGRIHGSSWPELCKKYPDWDNPKDPCANIKLAVALLCRGGGFHPSTWDTYRLKGERAACFTPCMKAIAPPKRKGKGQKAK